VRKPVRTPVRPPAIPNHIIRPVSRRAYENHKGGISNVKFSYNTFKIILYWCLDLIRHNIGAHLKLNTYIFDISIPFCHHLCLSAILKQCFTEFAVCRTTFHHVDMSVRGRMPTCDLTGRLFLGSGLQRMC
jgi:hypothetical protein